MGVLNKFVRLKHLGLFGAGLWESDQRDVDSQLPDACLCCPTLETVQGWT